MARTTDFKFFAQKTGMISDYEFLIKLSLVPCTVIGTFHWDRIEELTAFCKKNPEYHIVSQLNPNVLLNRLSKSATLFFLADGDQDKNLVYDLSSDSSESDVSVFRAA